jgi:hypothetical protein
MKMSLNATCRAVCDNCGTKVVREVHLDERTAGGIMDEEISDGKGGFRSEGRSYAQDIWSWCFPDGWIQVVHDEKTGQNYLFFCGKRCYERWLRAWGRDEEAEEFERGVWRA